MTFDHFINQFILNIIFNFEFYLYIVLAICAIHSLEPAVPLVLIRVTVSTTHHWSGTNVLSHDGLIPLHTLISR